MIVNWGTFTARPEPVVPRLRSGLPWAKSKGRRTSDSAHGSTRSPWAVFAAPRTRPQLTTWRWPAWLVT